MSVMIWVQTICKGYQQTTKVAVGRQRVKEGLLHVIWDKCHYKTEIVLRPSLHGLVTDIQVNVYIGKCVKAKLSKLTYVED